MYRILLQTWEMDWKQVCTIQVYVQDSTSNLGNGLEPGMYNIHYTGLPTQN